MRFKAILFDLDGTLLNTLDDLADSMNAALIQMGFPPHPVDAYRYFVGDGVENEAVRALPAGHHDKDTVKTCVALASEQYHRRWSAKTQPYPGIDKLLTALEKKGIPRVILSNKPDEFTQLIVAKLLGNWTFQIVRGVGPTVPVKPDPGGALAIADEMKIPPKDFLYLGDTNTDMKTAVSAGMYPVGALWGFRTADELLENGAKILLEKPLDLLDVIEKA